MLSVLRSLIGHGLILTVSLIVELEPLLQLYLHVELSVRATLRIYAMPERYSNRPPQVFIFLIHDLVGIDEEMYSLLDLCLELEVGVEMFVLMFEEGRVPRRDRKVGPHAS